MEATKAFVLLTLTVASIAGGLVLIARSIRPAKVRIMKHNNYTDEHLGI